MITIDVNSERSIFAPGGTQEVSVLNYKRRLVGAQRVQFSSGPSVVELPNDATGIIEFKIPGRYDEEPITGAASWTKFGSGSGAYYVFLFGLISDDLDRLFGYNAAAPFTVSGDLISATAHKLVADDIVNFNTDDTLPDPYESDVDYYVLAAGLTANAFKVSLTPGGPAIVTTNGGTGTQSFVKVGNDVAEVKLIADIYVIHSSGTVEIKSQTFDVTVQNDVSRVGDTIPTSPAIVYQHDSFWREGSGVPSDSLGLDGDFYINTLFGAGYYDVYMRDGGTYSLIGNIAGKGAGFRYIFNSATSGDPGNGHYGFDNSAFADITQLRIGETDASGNSLDGFLAFQDDSTSSKKCLVIARKVGGDKFFSFFITGPLTDHGIYDSFPIQPVTSSGGVVNGDQFELTFIRTGDKGDPGPAGTSSGPQGAQGTQGNQGFQGLQGTAGAQGNQGFQGTDGAAPFLTGAAALNFPSTNSGESSDLTITVTGASLGDPVILGVPNGSVLSNSEYSAWVSASNTVTVRFLNTDAGAQDPASGTFKVAVFTGIADPFSPLSISGLKLWLDAGSLSLSDSDPVSSWTDLSGNTNHAVQASGGLQPTFKTGIINGRPIVRFDGSNDILVAPNPVGPPASCFIVCSPNAAVGSENPYAILVITSGIWISGRLNSSTNWGSFMSSSGEQLALDDLSSDVPVLLEQTQGTSTPSKLYKNGVLKNTQTDVVASTANTNVQIGADGSSRWANYDIAEVIIYDSVLSAPDQASIEAYLTAKYGL